MRVVFAGTPQVAVPSLSRLAASRHEVVAVLTRPDAPLGRKRVMTPSPVAAAAEALGIPVIRTAQLTDEVTTRIEALRPELGVIVAYGGFVREPLLSLPTHGWINLHFSLLPRWRGAAPVQRAIMAGDRRTGASVFQLEAGMDTGPVFATITTPIGAEQSAGELLDELAVSGAELLAGVVDAIDEGTARPVAQLGESSLAPKLSIDDARIDWAEPIERVHARIRGVTPEPGAFTMLGESRLKVLAARIPKDAHRLPAGHIVMRDETVLIGTGTDALELVNVQPAGGRVLPAATWWHGATTSAELVAR